MNRDDIIRMAREAMFDLDGMANMLYTVRGNYAQLERLVKAAYAAGAKAGLHVVNAGLLRALEKIALPDPPNSDYKVSAEREALREIARAAIARERGEK